MKTKMSLLALCLPFFVGVPLMGCSDDSDDDHDHGDLPAECEAIRAACHEKDPGTPGDVNTCHATSHAGVAADCAAVRTECIAACDAAPLAS